MSSCVFSLMETSTYPAWLRPRGWLCHTSEQLTNCSQLSGVKELISEKWHFLTCFLKRQVCLLFFYTSNDLCTLKWPLNVLFYLTSISTLAFFSDLTSIFNSDVFSFYRTLFRCHKRRDIIAFLVKQYTLTLGNASLLLHLIGIGGLLALIEENDFCIQHENVLWTA